MIEIWLTSLREASLRGGIALLVAWALCQVPRVPAVVRCWVWRSADAVLLISFIWTTPIKLPLLRAHSAMTGLEARQLDQTDPVPSQPFVPASPLIDHADVSAAPPMGGKYAWPGNIRESQSVIKQAMLQARGPVLLPAFLPELSSSPAEVATPASIDLDLETFVRQRLQPDARDLYAEAHGQLDRFLLTAVLEYTGGSQHQAARLLGIARQTLRIKLRDLGVRVTQSVETEGETES